MNHSLRTAILAIAVLTSTPCWGHVVVTPSQAGVGTWVTFTVSVPNEKDVANTQLKLLLPSGIASVTPTVKPGWKITVEKDANGAPTALLWSGGNLPSGFRDEFTLSAQVPAAPTNLAWKAYQTYQGGEVVGWDVDPNDASAKDAEALEQSGKGPYSVTKVVDDLAPHAMVMTQAAAPASSDSPTATIALIVSIVALLVGLAALVRRSKTS